MLLVNDLSCSFKDIVNTVSLRDLFRLNFNRVLGQAELTVPHLTAIVLRNFAVLIEHSLALGTYDWVTCGQLSCILQAAKFHQEHIGVNFLLVLSLLLFAEETLCRHHASLIHLGGRHRLRLLLLSLGWLLAEELSEERSDATRLLLGILFLHLRLLGLLLLHPEQRCLCLRHLCVHSHGRLSTERLKHGRCLHLLLLLRLGRR